MVGEQDFGDSRGSVLEHGWHAANAVWSQSCLDGVLNATAARNVTARQVIELTLIAVAQLSDDLGLETAELFTQTLYAARRERELAPQPSLPGYHAPADPELLWSSVPQPACATERHAERVLSLLADAGVDGVTTTELRHLGVKNPSNVVLRLIRRGYRIRRSNEHHPNQHGGHTRYVLSQPSFPAAGDAQ